MAKKHVALYVRVSSNKQDTKSQEPDLRRWAASQDEPVKFYRDKKSGKTMDRPGWNRIEASLRAGKGPQTEREHIRAAIH